MMGKTAANINDPDFLDRLINEQEAAAFLGFTIRALQNWRVRGGGPEYLKLGSRSVRYQRRTLMAWIDGLRVRNTTDALACR